MCGYGGKRRHTPMACPGEAHHWPAISRNPLEAHQPAGEGVALELWRVPVDAGASGELEQVAALEVHEQQAGPRVHRQVPQRVEVIVAGVVGEDDLARALDRNETGRAATMRGVCPSSLTTSTGAPSSSRSATSYPLPFSIAAKMSRSGAQASGMVMTTCANTQAT